ELKQNLVALGFDRNHQITINNTFDSATTTAVEAWQSARGETQTGTVTLGDVVFLPGAQRITQVNTVLGSTGGSSSGSAAGV
ncbi:peptidoglycan-binding protein, partial [Acinetobacter baumannii]